MRQNLKLFVGDETLLARRAICLDAPGIGENDQTCPSCRNPKRKYKIAARLTQFGFEWDTYTDFRKCRCGQLYFAEYKIWHDMAHLNTEIESVVSE